MGLDLPEHVEIKIDPNDIEYLSFYLKKNGYKNTLFQVVKPYQIFGLVKQVEYNEHIVEHHIRAYANGTVTTEIELRRIEDMWLHLTSKSRSAHERVIHTLEELSIDYSIDDDLRSYYNDNIYSGFPRDYTEFFRWFFIGVCFHTPLGYLWKLSQWLRQYLVLGRPEITKQNTNISGSLDFKNK